ncbi:hypothetical protein QFC21_000045 [Naganishia friedmannii]|uniref:Uncharacterized protein n=1 Tax=Naganishia friedmannii TaxID=89922 RepID=A0ACC2WBK9_9TREE|nr:hypothetical protein QFC21_000045 [Naganishia friedmannii]
MPGSKRRALKNLLSPHSHSTSSPSTSPSAASSTSPNGNSSLAPADEMAIVQGMEARQHLISPRPNMLGPAEAQAPVSVPSVNVNGYAAPTSPPPHAQAQAQPNGLDGNVQANGAEQSLLATSPPRKRSLGGFAGLYSRNKDVSPTPTPPTTADELLAASDGKKKKSSKQRFAEREARKKEALVNAAPPVDDAANVKLEREKQEEEQIITSVCRDLGVQLHEIEPDGHCMYSAIADQLYLLGLTKSPTYTSTRRAASHYLAEHADAFLPFVASIHGEDMAGATDDGMMTAEGYREYCKRVEQSGDWGGEIEIQALSKYYNIPIHVIQHGPPHIISHTPVDEGSGPLTPEQAKAAGERVVRISYHRRMYGLGEHYNSLRPITSA